MPLQLKKVEIVNPKIVDVAKISDIKISIKRQTIELTFEFGTISLNGELTVSDRQAILLSGDSFLDIASRKPSKIETIYEVIGEVCYSYVVEKKLLKYDI